MRLQESRGWISSSQCWVGTCSMFTKKTMAWFSQDDQGAPNLPVQQSEKFSPFPNSFQKNQLRTTWAICLTVVSPNVCRWDFHWGPERNTKQGRHHCNQLPAQGKTYSEAATTNEFPVINQCSELRGQAQVTSRRRIVLWSLQSKLKVSKIILLC